MEIWLQPLGEVERGILEELAAGIRSVFGCPIALRPGAELPQAAFNPQRGQHLSDLCLEQIKRERPPQGRILGVTESDLYTEGLNFVFGQADSAAGAAIISLHLLHQSQHGLPEDGDLLRERALKEAVHELGHTFGLGHCAEGSCVMHFSGTLFDTDLKQSSFCSHCQPRLMF